MLFARHFLFFPPVEADLSLALPDCEELNEVEQFCKNCETELHSSEPDVIQDIRPLFNRASVLRRYYIYAGGTAAPSPLHPLRHLLCGCKSMKTKKLGMKAIRATHTQIGTSSA